MFDAESVKSPWDDEGYLYYCMDQLQAVRAGDWKLYLPLENKYINLGRKTAPSPLELYDVRHDIGEEHEVSADHPEIVKRLLKMAERARAEIGDVERHGSGQREEGFVKMAIPLEP